MKIDFVAWMQRNDPNGEFDGITEKEALEIVTRWHEDSNFSDKGCKKIIDYLTAIC